MLLVLQGNDTLSVRQTKREIFSKYKEDDFNFTELRDSIEISSLVDALQASPLMVDYYFVVVHLNKRQFIRLKEYFKPTSMTVLLLILEDFILTDELKSGLNIDKLYTCQQLSFKDNVKWIQQKAKSLGYSLDLEDRKHLALMFQTSKELNDVLFQMAMLNDYDRSEFFQELFSTKQKFVWDLLIELISGNKKEFYTKYALQYKQNIGLTASQFNMKLIGGLIYCINSWKNAPSWIYEKLQDLEDREEHLIPFLYSHLTELLVMARKENSNIPILMRFTEIIGQIRKV